MKHNHNKRAVEVDGKLILNSQIERWTPLARECYARGCNCDGCNIFPNLETLEKCKIKDYVRGYILRGIYPTKENENNEQI